MVRTDLEALLGNLGAFYERKAKPGDMTFNLWFEKVKNIPSDAIPWIQNRIMDECDMWPRNITATVWAMYHAWLRAHPEKRAYRESVDCPDCEGGWLILQKVVENKFGKPMYEHGIPTFTAPCGKCRQLPMRNYVNLYQALERGYERVNLASHTAARRTVKEMVDSIGRPIQGPRTGIHWD